jgi:hypothetical protein
MIKNITIKWLEKNNACRESVEQWHKETDHETFTTLTRLSKNNPKWGNWLIVRLMTHDQRRRYAIYAAEQVIGIYETKYPNDKRPRQAIDAAKNYLKNKSVKNFAAAGAAGAAEAAGAAWAAGAAAWAAGAAAWAAEAAAGAAWAAAGAAWAAGAAAWAAEAAAGAAARAAMLTKIVTYGINLLKPKKEK